MRFPVVDCADEFVLDTIVAPFTSDYLSTYLSLCPSPNDAVLSFGPMDTLLTSAQHYIPTRLYSLFPHPAQDSGEKRRYIAVLSSRYVCSTYRLMVAVHLLIPASEMLTFHAPLFAICIPRVGAHLTDSSLLSLRVDL